MSLISISALRPTPHREVPPEVVRRPTLLETLNDVIVSALYFRKLAMLMPSKFLCIDNIKDAIHYYVRPPPLALHSRFPHHSIRRQIHLLV